jgi:kindlin 2
LISTAIYVLFNGSYDNLIITLPFNIIHEQELLGIASNRLLRMALATGDTIKTFRFSDMKTWSVNWEIKQVRVTFETDNVDFQCLTADCKVLHEFIGGYIFLSMRSGDKNQTLDENMFHKLTGGWD